MLKQLETIIKETIIKEIIKFHGYGEMEEFDSNSLFYTFVYIFISTLISLNQSCELNFNNHNNAVFH